MPTVAETSWFQQLGAEKLPLFEPTEWILLKSLIVIPVISPLGWWHLDMPNPEVLLV
jgi:hypothetical protein